MRPAVSPSHRASWIQATCSECASLTLHIDLVLVYVSHGAMAVRPNCLKPPSSISLLTA